jgi:D-glycerate 3-kinase
MAVPAFRPPWPDAFTALTDAEYAELWPRIRPGFLERMRAHGIDENRAEDLAAVYLPLAAWVKSQKTDGSLVLGVNGAQGSGKSTLCDFLRFVLNAAYGFRVAGFSIDDIYKTRTERERLAGEIHPLLITRGVPGTHDPELGLATIQALKSAAPDTLTPLPAFDKAADDRQPSPAWPVFRGRPDVVILEGWCVGAKAQTEDELADPVNDLEKTEDPDGTWRRHVNERLKGDYSTLFAQLDRLIMLEVPGLDSVFEWRSLQERKLAGKVDRNGQHRLMDAAALRRFVRHYERLTRHMLGELPNRADLVLTLDEQHQFTQITLNR